MTWLFPSLVSIMGYIIYHDVSEIKADVKALMAQSNIDKTRIDNLERAVFSKVSYQIPNHPYKQPVDIAFHKYVATKPEDEVVKIVKIKKKM